MIGKPLSTDELQKVLDRQAEKDKFENQIEEELKALKPGECLAYNAPPEVPFWVPTRLTLVVDGIKGLKMIREENLIYIYREK